MYDKLIFEMGNGQKNTVSLPENDFPVDNINIPQKYLRSSSPALPEVAEIDVMRHFVNLSGKNHHILKDIYPLGSCTMKYNPIVNEEIAAKPEFLGLHPYQDIEDCQGIMSIIYELQEMLRIIAGFDSISLTPVAGAHSEFAGMMIIREYHSHRGNDKKKNILIPDSAHGTNPASCTLSGFNTVEIKSGEDGEIDIEDLRSKTDSATAGIMITNPNTLGIFESRFDEIAEIIHSVDGLIYMDGANLNALMGIVKPGNIGCDILHFNLHKTFSTPHGGGGPGSGGVAVNKKLSDYLPPFVVNKKDGQFVFERPDKTMGAMHMYMGNINVMIKAWAYIKAMGEDGLKYASEMAVINANYIKSALKDIYELPFKTQTMHEFVLSGSRHKKEYGIRTLDIAKRMLDKGIHAPTVYFPLIVSEALMIEPTETESIETLDRFIEIMKEIDKEAKESPGDLKKAPVTTPVGRLNELKAMKNLDVNYYKRDSNV
ncbi:MAG: aminomethyl-transferring glycine dehydrogenase subunit GcvPB [bacterium]